MRIESGLHAALTAYDNGVFGDERDAAPGAEPHLRLTNLLSSGGDLAHAEIMERRRHQP